MNRISQNSAKLRTSAATLALAAGLALTLPGSAYGLSLTDVINGAYRGEGQPTDLFSGGDALIPRLINLMLFIVGILAIVFLIFGGIRYVISGGDKSKVDAAKNTILYAIVGLVVAILGYAVVNWVIGVVGNGNGGGGVV
ncbi:pilin [Candidatus Saccharibacteria bacterium]|nr:pilin [Candidatus Saccharibacteria bacterium]